MHAQMLGIPTSDENFGTIQWYFATLSGAIFRRVSGHLALHCSKPYVRPRVQGCAATSLCRWINLCPSRVGCRTLLSHHFICLFIYSFFCESMHACMHACMHECIHPRRVCCISATYSPGAISTAIGGEVAHARIEICWRLLTPPFPQQTCRKIRSHNFQMISRRASTLGGRQWTERGPSRWSPLWDVSPCPVAHPALDWWWCSPER
jgi:hypothetical protein